MSRSPLLGLEHHRPDPLDDRTKTGGRLSRAQLACKLICKSPELEKSGLTVSQKSEIKLSTAMLTRSPNHLGMQTVSSNWEA